MKPCSQPVAANRTAVATVTASSQQADEPGASGSPLLQQSAQSSATVATISLSKRHLKPLLKEKLDVYLIENEEKLTVVSNKMAKVVIEFEIYLLSGMLGSGGPEHGECKNLSARVFDEFGRLNADYEMGAEEISSLKEMVCVMSNEQLLERYGLVPASDDEGLALLRSHIIRLVALSHWVDHTRAQAIARGGVAVADISTVTRYLDRYLRDMHAVYSRGASNPFAQFACYTMFMIHLISLLRAKDIVEYDKQYELVDCMLTSVNYLLEEKVVSAVDVDGYYQGLIYAFMIYIREYDAHAMSHSMHDKRIYTLLMKMFDTLCDDGSIENVEGCSFEEYLVRYACYTKNYDSVFFLYEKIYRGGLEENLSVLCMKLIQMAVVKPSVIENQSVISTIFCISGATLLVDLNDVEMSIGIAKRLINSLKKDAKSISGYAVV